MKKIGPRRGAHLRFYYVDPPLVTQTSMYSQCIQNNVKRGMPGLGLNMSSS